MKAIQLALIVLVYGYRWILSPAKNLFFGGPSCRFHPTCSAYALEALQRHGPFHGSLLTTRRLCRCHPWGGAGADPVPDLIRL
jgi:putative membrane protein insertion efficiency factor